MRHSGLEFTGIIEVQVMKKALGYVLWLFALLALYPVILDGNDAALLMRCVGTVAYVRSASLEASQVDKRKPLRSGPTLAKL
ncbi:MAG: hypothetical protein CM15mP84_03020 [Cellvibrionales bacterium]|nr:MAG: hypothetical protein CM15mP84_03020 [Cellvibrionales bacterium]